MPVEVKKRGRESVSAMLRRFTRKVQQSGVLLNAKKSRFREKQKSKREQKETAIRREKLKRLKRRLIREGEIEEGEMLSPETIKKYLDKD